MGYGQPMGGGGGGMGLLIGVELAEAFVKEQQRAAMLKQQLATQQQLGADQAPHAMDHIVHYEYIVHRGSTPLTLTLTLTLTRLRQQTEELMQEPDFVEQITKAFAGIGEPPKKD